MTRDWRWARPWGGLLFLNMGLLAPWALIDGPVRAMTLSGELTVGVALLAMASARFGRVLTWVGGLFWTWLLAYGIIAAFGAWLMDETPLLYDTWRLSMHLWVVSRDLVGVTADVVVVATLVGLVGLTAVARAAAASIHEALMDRELPDRRRVAASLVVLATVGLLAPGPWPARWAMPSLATNIWHSLELRAELRREFDTSGTIPDLVSPLQPDVLVYIVESYGRVMGTHPAIADRWQRALSDLATSAATTNWHTASGFDDAPVKGSRSWLADATMFTGIDIEHESKYRQLVDSGAVSRMAHLPAILSHNGWETVLVRQRDQARPGVRLNNYFDFGHTVFQDDLPYRGERFGWGGVPDQFVVNHVHDEVLAPLEGPRFAFFHLASSHAPWHDEPPSIVDDYRVLGGASRPVAPPQQRPWLSATRHLARKFKRQVDDRPNFQGEPGLPNMAIRYGATVVYDLRVLGQTLETRPERPTLVLILGDHQPPYIARHDDQAVPVHVFATEPALLAPFTARGFTPGVSLDASAPAVIAHRELHGLILDAVQQGPRQ